MKIFYFGLLANITMLSDAFSEPDFYHHRNILPGSRAAALGGAYTALSDDPSGSFYNPSGLAFGQKKEISVSVNSRHEKTITYKNIKALNNQNFIENSVTFFPSFAGTSYKFKNLAIGWSYMTLDASNIDQSDRFNDLNEGTENTLQSYNRTHQESNSYFLAGSNVAFGLGKYFALGASGFYYRRDIIATNHQLVVLKNGSYLTSDQKYTTLNEGLYPIYGAMLKFENISFGISHRKPQSITNNTVLHSDRVSSSAGSNNVEIDSKSLKVLSFDEINPQTTQIGLALTWSGFLLSTDIIQHHAKKSNLSSKEFDLINTYNYAAGCEISIGILKVRSGIFTNNTQAKPLNATKVNQPTHIDYVGTSFSLAIQQKGFGGSIVFTEQTGEGESQKLSDDLDIQKVDSYSRTIQLGANYDF